MIRSPYTLEADRVLCDGVRLKADRATFEILAGEWGRDAKSVYHREKRMKADRATFEALSSLFARDKENVYEETFRVRGADAPSFEVLAPERRCDDEEEDGDYARDREHVFYRGAEKTAVVRDADPATFRAVGWRFGRDAQHVFWERARLPGSDPSSWERLERYHSRDARQVYWMDRPIRDADRATFQVLPGAAFARDAHRYYAQGEPTSPESFWDGFGKLTIFVGAIDRVALAWRRIDAVIRVDEVLQTGRQAPGATLATSLHLEQDELADRWTGLSRIWFAEEERHGAGSRLTPAFHWRTFWPLERRADVERLVAEHRSR